jgi:hypothetical protein
MRVILHRRLHHAIFPCVAVLMAIACGSNHAGLAGDGAESGNGSPSGVGDDASLGPGSDSDGSFMPGQGSGDGGDAAPPIPVTTTLVDRCTTGAPSGLSAAAVKSLMAGGSAGSMRFLYPYAKTIFPRGLIAPTLMWDGASADYVYVHLKSNAFEYKGCLAPTATGQLLLPQDVWVAASSHAAGEADPFTLSLTTIASGTVTGPISEPLVIAPATLKGSIFYNSYTTKLSSGVGGFCTQVIK